ncbi:MAG: cbb3-type cytochrome oxidase assembly protein CcoS [Pseudomonadota bacterium]
MSVLIFLIPIALGLGALGLWAFMWSLKAGQYDDPDGAAQRILLDDDLDENEPPHKPESD